MALPLPPVLPRGTWASGRDREAVLVPARQQRHKRRQEASPAPGSHGCTWVGAVPTAAHASGAGNSVPGWGTPQAARALPSPPAPRPRPWAVAEVGWAEAGSIALEDEVPVPTDRQGTARCDGKSAESENLL